MPLASVRVGGGGGGAGGSWEDWPEPAGGSWVGTSGSPVDAAGGLASTSAQRRLSNAASRRQLASPLPPPDTAAGALARLPMLASAAACSGVPRDDTVAASGARGTPQIPPPPPPSQPLPPASGRVTPSTRTLAATANGRLSGTPRLVASPPPPGYLTSVMERANGTAAITTAAAVASPMAVLVPPVAAHVAWRRAVRRLLHDRAYNAFWGTRRMERAADRRRAIRQLRHEPRRRSSHSEIDDEETEKEDLSTDEPRRVRRAMVDKSTGHRDVDGGGKGWSGASGGDWRNEGEAESEDSETMAEQTARMGVVLGVTDPQFFVPPPADWSAFLRCAIA